MYNLLAEISEASFKIELVFLLATRFGKAKYLFLFEYQLIKCITVSQRLKNKNNYINNQCNCINNYFALS